MNKIVSFINYDFMQQIVKNLENSNMTNTFIKCTERKVSTHIIVTFLYLSNQELEKQMLKIPDAIASKP